MGKALEMMRQIGKQSEIGVMAALPGTISEIAKRANLSRDCTEKVIRRLRAEGLIVVTGKRPSAARGGTPQLILDDAESRDAVIGRMKVPVTGYRSIFIGGNPWMTA